MKISEVFGQSTIYTIQWRWGGQDDLEAYGTFMTSDGREGRLLFQETSVEDPQVVDFEFEVANTKSVSGGGDQYAIFNTAIHAVETYLKTKQPEYITFSAKEPNRFRIYSKLVNKLVGGYGTGVTKYQWLSSHNYPKNMPPGNPDFVLAKQYRRQSGDLPSVRNAAWERELKQQQATQQGDQQ